MSVNTRDTKTYIIGVPYTNCEYVSEIPCTSEPEAVAIAVGIMLGGGRPFVFMQDSGYLNSLNNITSLIVPYGIKGGETHIENVKEPEHHKYSNALFREVYDTLFGS